MQAIVRSNRFRLPGDEYGVYIYENARVRLSGNQIQGGGKGGVLVQGDALVDLGGGRVVIAGDSEPSPGGNVLRANQPADLVNETKAPIQARRNYWDHTTTAEVLSADIRGKAEIEPVAKP